MPFNLIFIHGWGMDARIWDGMSIYFPKNRSYFVDFGFFSSKNAETPPKSDKNIYITHSLGTLWALKKKLCDIDALIVINGFACFKDFADKRTLRAMQKNLCKNPSAQLDAFWKNCGFDNQLDENPDIDKLHEGLEWLIGWDEHENLKVLDVPILSLSGAQDRILPLEKMQKHWAGFEMKTQEDAGHMLPLSRSAWCVDQIKDFLREHSLET